jgi:hypothetical protein
MVNIAMSSSVLERLAACGTCLGSIAAFELCILCSEPVISLVCRQSACLPACRYGSFPGYPPVWPVETEREAAWLVRLMAHCQRWGEREGEGRGVAKQDVHSQQGSGEKSLGIIHMDAPGKAKRSSRWPGFTRGCLPVT